MHRFFLILSIVFILASCGSNSTSQSGTQSDTSDVAENGGQASTAQDNKTSGDGFNVERALIFRNKAGLLVNHSFGFKIWFPEDPPVFIDSIINAGIKIYTITYLYQGDGFAYMLMFSPYPESVIEGQNPDTLLRNVMYGFSSSQNLNIEQTEYKKVQGRPALLYRGYEGDFYVVALNVLDDHVLYQIIMANDGEYPDPEAIDHFIGSFEFTN